MSQIFDKFYFNTFMILELKKKLENGTLKRSEAPK